MKALKYLIPLAVFLGLAAFFAVGLTRDPRTVPSPFIDKPAPQFRLEQLGDTRLAFTPEDMKGKVWMLNVWASWCSSCRIEHPILVEMSKRGIVPIVGLNYKDRREDALPWLARFGDPYALSVWDIDGKVGIDYGVYGVPETYVIDKAGVIRFKQIGPVTPQVVTEQIIPLVQQLQAS